MPKKASKKTTLAHYDKKKTIAKYPKAPIVEHFDSAENAFKSLNIGDKFDKRHATRRCKALEKLIMSGSWTKYANADDYCTIFRNYPHSSHLPFKKSLKMGQVNGTNIIVLFSDQYDERCMEKLRSTCAAGGVPIVPFVKKYSETYGTDDFTIDTKKVKMLCTGYNNLYRGVLCGFYILGDV